MTFNRALPRSVLLRYAVAALAVVVGCAVCFLIGGVMAERPFIALFFVVVPTAIAAGPGPGVFATLFAAALGDYLFLAPVGALSIEQPEAALRLCVFLAAALISIAGMACYESKKQAALSSALTRLSQRLRQQADATLRDSEERCRLLFDTSSDGIAITDMNGRIQDANPAFQEKLGYSLTELKQLSACDLTPARWRDAEAEIREHVMLQGDSGEYEKEYIRKDGSVFPASVRAWPVYDGGRKLIGVGAFVRDITERKRAEEALRASDRRKEEFLATLAHELRNPLAPIRNAVYILKHAGAFPEGRERKLLDIADRQVNHLIRLVDDLLDYSRISNGKIELRRARIDLIEVVGHAIETAQPAISLGGHRLETRFRGEPLTVDGDPIRLAQVFANLLDNAAKYTQHGGRIALTVERRGDEAVAAVEDNGVGIPPEMLARIFDYFTQVDNTPSRARGGLGIGLALVRRLVALHGGSVEAQSAGEGLGSAFTVRLPLALDASGACAETDLAREAAQ